ncbi:unnamed protein product [Lactuca saligna]|uniref:Uncharacterized protein n=1 Tax=Lactuca saligna TaxID=75948 RepID=A0AA35YTF6_LACSI|nr:unnamed protein product [Lactuca saligna]
MAPCDASGASEDSDLIVVAARCLVGVCLTKHMNQGGWNGVLRWQWVQLDVGCGWSLVAATYGPRGRVEVGDQLLKQEREGWTWWWFLTVLVGDCMVGLWCVLMIIVGGSQWFCGGANDAISGLRLWGVRGICHLM